MDIFQNQYYRSNVIMLMVIGLWPHQKSRPWQLFQQVMCQVAVISVILPQAIKLFEIWGDLDDMIECITPIGVQVVAVIKASNYIFHRKAMMILLESMRRDWSGIRNEREMKIHLAFVEHGRNINLVYTGFMALCTTIYLMVPLLPIILNVIVPLNESRPVQFLYSSEYFLNEPMEFYTLIVVHTYAGSCVCMTTIVAADTMFVCYVMHVCGILAVLGDRLERLTLDRSNSNEVYVMSRAEDERCHREIVHCIDLHYKATEVIDIIESCYSMSYLFVLGMSVVLLSISAVQLVIKFGQVDQMIRMFQLNLAQCNHLLFNSWPCQKLIDQNCHFRESLYAAEWYSLSEVDKHLLRFAMMRTREPQKITAGKLYVMSMENFRAVMQASISYFTVFASIR